MIKQENSAIKAKNELESLLGERERALANFTSYFAYCQFALDVIIGTINNLTANITNLTVHFQSLHILDNLSLIHSFTFALIESDKF